jgi:hypothetical protein
LHAATDQSIKFGIWPNQTNPVLGITDGAKWCCSPAPVFTVSEPIKHEHKYVYTGKNKLRIKLENISHKNVSTMQIVGCGVAQIGCGVIEKGAAWLN